MIVVCGEALIDLVPARSGEAYEARPGGGPLNVAVGLGRLGGGVGFLGRPAHDPVGRRLPDPPRRPKGRPELIAAATPPGPPPVLHPQPSRRAAVRVLHD